MKNFIKETQKIKKMSASELAATIYDYQDDIVHFFISGGFKRKNQNIMKDLHHRMFNKKFPKALKKVIKVGKKEEDHKGLNIGFVMIIANFIEKNHSSENMTEELLTEYSDVIDSLLKSRVKEVKKKIDIDEEIIRELLMITPDVKFLNDDKFVGIYSQKMLRKLYIFAKDNENIGLEDTKQVRRMFKVLFNKKLIDLIAVNILLEKKEYMKNFNENQIKIWNLMTAFALETIDKEEGKHIQELLEYYCIRRKTDESNDRDAARRITGSMISSDDYPNIAKAIEKFSSKKNKKNLVKYL